MYNKKVLSKIDLGKFTKLDPYKDDIIYDPMGQWKYPGQNTRIPSGNITMKGVNKPLLGVASTGEKKMMQPGQEYNFPGADYVDEFPQAEEGMIVDLTPAQIEEYRKGGYIIEELDEYAAGGKSSSCPEGMVWSKKDNKCIKLLFNSNTLTNIKNRLNSTTGIPLTTLSDGLKIKPLNSFSDFGKEKPMPIRKDSFLETLETDINDFLEKPLERAANIAHNLAEKGEDASDPLRHSTAGALTAQTIANKTGNIPFISNPLGFLGSNIAGIGHELSTLYNTDLDDRPWSVKLQESLEDIYNNSVGASTIFNNKSEKDKINYLLHLTRTNQLPDGYGEKRPFKDNPKWTDPYNQKKEGGALNRFVKGGEPCPEGFQEDPVTGDCVVITERTQDIQEVPTNQYSKYFADYESANPRDMYVYQKKADFLRRNKSLNRMAGLSQDNFNTNVEGNYNRHWVYDRNTAVIEQFAKDHGINPNNHVEIVEKMADLGPTSYNMIARSKYGSKLQPSLWNRSLAGAQELGNAAVKGIRGVFTGKTGKDVFNKEIKGLTKKENKEIHESNFGALESLAWMDAPGAVIGNAVIDHSLATGGNYEVSPGIFSGELKSNMDPLKAALLNPVNYADLGLGLATAGMTGLRVGTKAASTLSKVDNIVDIANTVRQVDNAAPLLAKVDNVLPLAKVDDARSIKKVPAIINKTDNVVPKKPQGVQQEIIFPKDTPLPKVETPKPVVDNVPVDDIVNVEKNTARAENEVKIMEGMDNVAPVNKPVVPVEVPAPIPPTIAAPKPLPNKVGNPDFFKQVLDQSPNLSASNRKFYEEVIATVKKQGNVASDAQMELLERIRNGNHNYSGKFGNINSGVSPELVTGFTGETNPLFAGIANIYSNWIVDPLGGIFNKALTKASPLNAVPQYGNKVAGNVVDIGDILATGVKEGKLVVPKGIGKRGVQGVKKLFGKTDDVVDPLLIKKDKTSGGLYKAGLDPSAAGTDIKIAADAEKQGLIGRKFGKSNKEFKVTNKKDVPLSEIPLEDPGLTIYRRLPFSNKYIVVDKAKLAAGKAQWATTGGSAQKFGEAYGKGLIITGATGAVLWADAPSEKEVKEAKDKVDKVKEGNDKILSDTYDQNKKLQFKEKTITTLADGINKGVPLEQVINDLMTREKNPVSAEMLIEIFVDEGYSKEEAEDIVNSRIRENAVHKKGGIVLDIDKNKIKHWIEQGYHVEEVDDDE